MLPRNFCSLVKEHDMVVYGKDIRCHKLGQVVASIYSPDTNVMIKNTLIVTYPGISTEQRAALKTICLIHGIACN